jgi:hypothetical protein
MMFFFRFLSLFFCLYLGEFIGSLIFLIFIFFTDYRISFLMNIFLLVFSIIYFFDSCKLHLILFKLFRVMQWFIILLYLVLILMKELILMILLLTLYLLHSEEFHLSEFLFICNLFSLECVSKRLVFVFIYNISDLLKILKDSFMRQSFS